MSSGPAAADGDLAADDGLATELLELAIGLARQAGAMVKTGRASGQLDVDTKSSSTDMVTQYDKASEALIVSAILRARPDDGLVGEEGTDRPGTSGIRWLVDPIDGTTNFLYDLPGYSVSIAAADDRGALIGVVFVPSSGELFTAIRGHGAQRDGLQIACGSTSDLGKALVATGFSYLPQRRRAQATRLLALAGEIRDIRRLGAASVDLCHLACGRIDVYYEQFLGPWDTAAGALIAAEAGAVIGTFPGFRGEPDGFLAATPALYPAILQRLTAIAAEDAGRGPSASGIM